MIVSQWFANVVQRLSVEDVASLVDMAQRMEARAAKFERLVDEMNLPD